jgi:outer membrane lipoprotein-sorting protein
MFKLSVQILWLLVLPIGLYAQPKDFKPIADVASFKRDLAEELTKIKTIQSSFTQEKNLAMLQEKITSEGKFWFQSTNKVRIQYEKPFRYLMIINGSEVTIRDEKKETKSNTDSNKLFQQINRILVDCVRGTILDNKDFQHQVFENDKHYLLRMTPVSKTLKQFFKTIELTIDKSDATVFSIDMLEPGGDNTLMIFTNKKINEKLDEQIFN